MLSGQFFCTEILHLSQWVHNLSMEDRRILSSGKMLTANHISEAHYLLRKKFPLQNGLKDTHHLAVKLQWNSDPEKFVQIIFIEPNHWACLSNKFCIGNEVELFDSMFTIPTEDGSILKQACCITRSLNITESRIPINVIGVTPQIGATDCGLFAISMAYDLCCGIDPFTQQVVQDQMRKHLLSCFEKQEISSFPKIPRQTLDSRKRVVKSVSFEIYCVCRGPEVLPMASCDVCLDWFHPTCLHVPEEVFEYTDVRWICPSCKYTVAMFNSKCLELNFQTSI